jgi:hypothetical protein
MTPSPLSLARAGLIGALAAVALLVPERSLRAQTELPTVQIAQMPGSANIGFGGTARLRLDRDAFLVVLEIGADHRARILHPALPKDGAWTRSDRSVFVPLPSADAAFIRSAELRVPDIVAFVSDVEPNLEEFTERGRRWDYQYIVSTDEPLDVTVRSLASLLYGDPDMPYTVVTRREYPVLNRATFSSLSRCGYNLNAPYSPAFNDFLWQAFGPVSLLETSWAIDDRYRNFQWEGRYWFLASMSPLGLFQRSVGGGLWNTFGDPCDALRAQRLFYLNAWNTNTVAQGPLPPGTTPDDVTPVPGDRNPGARPPVVPGVDIVPVAPEEMQRRASAVTRLADARAESRATSRGPLTRESNEELVKRQEIATVMALLASQRQGGRGALDVMDVFQRVRAGQTVVADANGRASSSPRGGRSVGRFGGGSGGSGGFGGSGSVSSGSGGFGGGGGGGGSVGSGSSSGGGEARGGGGERGGSSGRGSGTGRP